MSGYKPFNPQTEYFTDYEQINHALDKMSFDHKQDLQNISFTNKEEATGGTIMFDISDIKEYLTEQCLESRDLLYDAISYLNSLVLKKNGVDISTHYAVATSLSVGDDDSCRISYNIFYPRPYKPGVGRVIQLPHGYQGESAELEFRHKGQDEKNKLFKIDADWYEHNYVSGWGY